MRDTAERNPWGSTEISQVRAFGAPTTQRTARVAQVARRSAPRSTVVDSDKSVSDGRPALLTEANFIQSGNRWLGDPEARRSSEDEACSAQCTALTAVQESSPAHTHAATEVSCGHAARSDGSDDRPEGP
jgi:hypothetical protein